MKRLWSRPSGRRGKPSVVWSISKFSGKRAVSNYFFPAKTPTEPSHRTHETLPGEQPIGPNIS